MDFSLWRRLISGEVTALPVSAMAATRKMEWAAAAGHGGGVPRRLILLTFGALARLVATGMNKTEVHNGKRLWELVKSRPPGTPLITASNHMSTIDDPVMWAHKGFPMNDPKLLRWILAADDICFTNPVFTYFFRLAKCIPICRSAGIYQPHMYEALDRINDGDWMHTFPEGKVCQELGPMRRFKWGVGSLIARASVPPIVLPMAHSGFEEIMPEKYMFGRRPLVPLWGKKITIVVGEPMEFDIKELAKIAEEQHGTNGTSPFPLTNNVFRTDANVRKPISQHLQTLDDRALGWLYSHITQQIQVAVENLRQEAQKKNSLF